MYTYVKKIKIKNLSTRGTTRFSKLTFNIKRYCCTDGATLVGSPNLVHGGIFFISLDNNQLVVTSLKLLDLDLLSIRLDLLSSAEPFDDRFGLSCDLADKGGVALVLDTHVSQLLLESRCTDLHSGSWNNGSRFFTVVTLTSEVLTLDSENVLYSFGQTLHRENGLFNLVSGHWRPVAPFLFVLLVLLLKAVTLDLRSSITKWWLPRNHAGVFGYSRDNGRQRWRWFFCR